jgi:hypothetical protein
MKSTLTKALFVAAVPFMVNVAFADDPTPEPAYVGSTVTRAQVLEELAQARANGELVNGEQVFVAKAPATPALSREQVRADAVAAAKTKKTQYQFENMRFGE